MDIGKMLIEGTNVYNDWGRSMCLDITHCSKLYMCESAQEVADRQPKKAGEISVFNSRNVDINEFLEGKFGRKFYDFMSTYNLRMFEVAGCLPIECTLFTCVFRKTDDAEKLIAELEDHQRILTCTNCGIMPNLHDNSVYIMTLIECNFDLLKYSKRFTGVYDVGQDYNFIIKVSSQLDMTILYKAK